MPHRRTTLSKFIIEDQRRRANADPQLSALLNDIQTACKFIAFAVSRGALNTASDCDLNAIAREILLRECEWGGQLCGMASSDMAEPYDIPAAYPRGRYLLVFAPLDGSSNLDVNATAGTIFSVLRAPDGVTEPTAAAFLQPGANQLAAGFALYGPASMIAITLGAGVHGFTLEPEIGAYMLTHAHMRVPEESREFALEPSNERFWEPPVRHYVEECTQGDAGPPGAEFRLRGVTSAVAEVYRILMRGGLVVFPRDATDRSNPGRLNLLHEANPLALIVEQAGGAATTGRERLLDIVPARLTQRVPVILGSLSEVERLGRYHDAFDRGEALLFETPLLKVRSLFRAAP